MKENLESTFDAEIRIRSALIGAALGYLARWNLDPEIAAAIGAVLGIAFDWAAFRLKVWLASREPR